MNHHWVAPFLDQLAQCGMVSTAARAVGVSSSTVNSLKSKDADFAAAMVEAKEAATDLLEAEARRRAVVGVQEPVVYQGQLTPVWEIDEHGQTLLENYEVAGKDGQVEVHTRPVQKLDANGRPVWLTVTKYSDALLALMLKGHRKAFATERSELTGADGADLNARAIDPTARAARLAAILAQGAKRKDDEQRFGHLA
jgi:hypothetical protein